VPNDLTQDKVSENIVHMWNLFKSAFKVATDFLGSGGIDSLQKNIEADPQILTGDPQFDVMAADIFQRVARKDPMVLHWTDEFKSVVGLYDQATKGISRQTWLLIVGNIPEDLKCEAPVGLRAMAAAAVKGNTVSIDNLVDKCRRGEHTFYFGTSKKEAIQEFKEHVAQLYAKNKQPLPVPVGKSRPDRDGSLLSSDTQFEAEWSDQGSISSGYDTPMGVVPLPAESAVITDGQNRVDGNIPAGRTIAVGNSRSRLPLEQSSRSATNTLLVPHKGWAPPTTLKIIAGTAVGFGLVAGVILLYNKIFRRERKPEGEVRSRIHARSWNQADVD
jgi:hypothetical protein